MIRVWFRMLNKLIGCCGLLATSLAFAAPGAEGIQVYQKNVHLSPEHKQKLADDISRYRNADNLWDVLRDEFSLQHYEDNPAVQAKIEWFMNNQDFLLRSATRASPYLYYISQQLKKRHLPAELVLLPIVESGYNPFSMSNVGASGIWQLMPSTATGLGVKRDWWYDGRRDVIASTRAALNYLAYLQSFFEGNWLLAMAAYNTGEGNVMAAIKRNVRDGLETDFWSLPVAQQTKDYVPSLLALAVIISHPDQYPVYFPPVRNAPYLAQVDVGTPINIKFAATLAGVSYQKMVQLNPGFNRPTTAAKGHYKLVLPIENVEKFTENLAHSPLNTQVRWVHYRVKTGDTLASIAKKFSVSVNDIKQMNHLSKANVRARMNLLIPSDTQLASNEDEANAFVEAIPTKVAVAPKSAPVTRSLAFNSPHASNSSATYYALQPGDTIYMVRNHDTMEGVAHRFNISVDSLRAANQFAPGKLVAGKQLIIPTHAGTTVVASQPINPLEPGDTLYMVRHGDTIEKIAGKFHIQPSAIRLANLTDNQSLNEGEKIIIPTHIKS